MFLAFFIRYYNFAKICSLMVFTIICRFIINNFIFITICYFKTYSIASNFCKRLRKCFIFIIFVC